MAANRKNDSNDVQVSYEYKPKTYWDEIDMFGMYLDTEKFTRKEICNIFNISQSALSNKLRLRKLPRSVREALIKNGLSERHARALLVIKNELQQHAIIRAIVHDEMSVAQTERFIMQLGYESERRRVYRKLQRARKSGRFGEDFGGLAVNVQEVRLFVMNLKGSIKQLEKAGMNVKAAQFNKNDYFEFVVRIMKGNSGVEMKGA